MTGQIHFDWRVRSEYQKTKIHEEMYSDCRIVSDRAFDTHIKNLRKKLSNAGVGKDLVESVYGLGYRYAG